MSDNYQMQKNGWQECKLGDIAALINGFAFKGSDFLNSGVPVIKIKNVKPGKIILDNLSYVSALIASERKKYLINSSDILITMSGNRSDGSPDSWVGKVSLFKMKGQYLLNQRVGILRPIIQPISIEYLAFLLSSMEYQQHFINLANSSGGQANISPETILNTIITLPMFPEQRTIAGVLSSLDDKIDLLHRQNKTLEGMAEALWRQMFVEEAKTEWPMKEIEEIADKIQYGLTQSANTETIGPKFLRITDIQGGIVNWGKVPYCYTTEQEFLKYKLNTGDIVVARTGASTGENLFIINPPTAVFASYLIRIQFHNIALSRYVSIHMRSSEYFNYIEGILSGSAQPNANAKQLTSFKIQLPSVELLDKFYLSIKDLDAKYDLNSNQINKLSRLRDTLLPKLMSGEVKVTL